MFIWIQHALKLLIEANEVRPSDYLEKHWENMKFFVASEAKQGEVAWNHAMRTLVNTLRHFSHGWEMGVAQRLVITFIILAAIFFLTFKM